MKKIRPSHHGGAPELSKYARKRLDRLRESVPETIDIDPKAVRPPRERGVLAAIPSFTSRQEFMFLTTEDGEQLFLSVRTIEKSGFVIKPGDTIQCDVEPTPQGPCRRVAHIHRVLRYPRR